MAGLGRFGSTTLASSVAWAIAGVLVLACHSSLDLGRESESASGEGGDASGPSAESSVDASSSTVEAGVNDAPCDDVCDKLEGCGFFEQRSDAQKCAAECPYLPAAFRACVAESSCLAMQQCAPLLGGVPFLDGGSAPGDTGDIRRCQSRCDTAKFFSCLDAAEHANCRSLCASKPAAISDTYAGCAGSAGSRCPEQRDCYEQFAK